HGIQVPILIDEDGVVIDGHHRQKIAQELGIRCPKRQVIDKTESEKRTLALSLNVHRRHLTREQKRALIAESIKADPQLPDLQHAHRTGASDKTVTSVRRELEAHSEIPNDIPRVNARGQERPATYEREEPAPKPEAEPPGGVERSTDEPDVQKVTGMDNKHYPRPEPKEPQKPRAEAITNQFSSAIVDLNRVLDRFHRISTNENFQKNKDQIETLHGNDLARAISELQDLANQLN